MTMNWTMFWIGLGLFVIGIVIRLYYGMALKKMRQTDADLTNEKAKKYKTMGWIGYVLFWIGATMEIFAI